MDRDKLKAKEITEYFLGYLNPNNINKISKKQINEFKKEVYFMITTS